MRENRKVVYDFINNGGIVRDIGNKNKYDSLTPSERRRIDEVEISLTSVIAFYDGASDLVLKKYIPKKLFDTTTLYTAANFYNIAYEYISRRRAEDNKVYAVNYTKLLSRRGVKRKMKTLMSEDKSKIIMINHTKTRNIIMTGNPSIDKPWLKYYRDESVNSVLPVGE